MGKVEILHFLDVGKAVKLLLQNQNVCALQILTSIATFLIFQLKKVFENSLNTFEDIAFLLAGTV